MAREGRPPEIDGQETWDPSSPMLVDQGFTLARPNAKTRARSLYSKLGKVFA
jgi:hypothetical protein